MPTPFAWPEYVVISDDRITRIGQLGCCAAISACCEIVLWSLPLMKSRPRVCARSTLSCSDALASPLSLECTWKSPRYHRRSGDITTGVYGAFGSTGIVAASRHVTSTE